MFIPSFFSPCTCSSPVDSGTKPRRPLHQRWGAQQTSHSSYTRLYGRSLGRISKQLTQMQVERKQASHMCSPAVERTRWMADRIRLMIRKFQGKNDCRRPFGHQSALPVLPESTFHRVSQPRRPRCQVPRLVPTGPRFQQEVSTKPLCFVTTDTTPHPGLTSATRATHLASLS